MTDEEQKRLERFKRLHPPEFSGGELEDAQIFLDSCHRRFRTMSRPAGAAPLTWHQLLVLFLEKFVPQTQREELCRDFDQLHHGDMTMTQYEMIFTDLARHAVSLVSTEREKIRRFIDDINYSLRYSLAREVEMDARFDMVVEIARRLENVHRLKREEREAKKPRGSGVFGGSSSGGQSHYSKGRPFRPAHATHLIPLRSSVSRNSYSGRPVQPSFSALPA
ncbi:uncharacterized protein [Nicotiana tomentosiformis]|uniref:uncharacterized protein n=1 Tax=Nicotiana tomentosiformis TaxID=4098 RepID=UPI00388C5FE6